MSVPVNMAALQEAAKPLLRSAVEHLQRELKFKEPLAHTVRAEGRELHVKVWRTETGAQRPDVGKFSISFLPGCRDVLVFHAVVVDPQWRGRGIGSYLHDVRLRIARAYGAKTVLCTVLSGNSAEKAIIRNAGWRVAIQVNAMVEMWSREL